MKKLILILSCFLWTICNLSAAQTFTFSFSEEDYQIVTDAQGLTTIYVSKDGFYDESTDPCLPKTTKAIALSPFETVVSFSIMNTAPRVIKRNVTLTSNPEVVSPSVGGVTGGDQVLYVPGRYPLKNCSFVSTTDLPGMSLANFAITPFSYDSSTGTLYFIDKIRITVNTGESSNSPMRMRNLNKSIQFANSIVSNPEDVDKIVSNLDLPTEFYNDTIEYLIITTEELKETLKKLVNWKRTKGIFTDIITVEEINSKYTGADLTEKIKRCIYDVYLNNNLQYVLLAGDDHMIPARKCYAKVGAFEDKSIPCDKYFGCFEGNFLWNANNNDVYGEIADNVNFSESVHIGRVSVRKTIEADAYIEKLINYETARDAKRLKKAILTGGVQKWNKFKEYSDRSDSDLQGDLLYNSYIKPYWNGQRVRFYDTGTDFSGNANYNVTPNNFQTQLSSDKLFMDFDTHGDYISWSLEDDTEFNTGNVQNIIDKSIPIVTTEACLTNGFDQADPCLSEAFIRSKSNSVIAYLGSSRYGWGYEDPTQLGRSQIYNGTFYKYLLGEAITNKNIGSILEAAKLDLQSNATSQNSYRWLQFSLNLMADPEIPVFTETPLSFKNVNIDFKKASNTLNVSVDTSGCTISVISWRDFGDSFQQVVKNTSNATFEDLPSRMVVCITKQNYEPFLYIIDNQITGVIQGKAEYYSSGIKYFTIHDEEVVEDAEEFPILEECIMNQNTQTLDVTISPNSDECMVAVQNVFGESKVYNINNGNSISLDMSNKQKGVYVVSLLKNGIILDSKKVIY